LSERLLPAANSEENSVSSSNHHSDMEVGHDDYKTMEHQNPHARSSISKRRMLIIGTIAVVAVVAIVCGVAFSSIHNTATNDAVSGPSTDDSSSSNNAAGGGVLDDTIPQPGSSSSSSHEQQQQPQATSETKMIRFDNDDNEYSGDYEYSGGMNMPVGGCVHDNMDSNNNDDMEYSGSYDSDYDYMGGSSTHQDSDSDYMSGSSSSSSNTNDDDDWMSQQHQHIKREQQQQQRHHQEHDHHYKKVHECVVSQDGQDLVVRGIDRQSQCVVRSDTQEVGVKFDDEAIFPGAANDMNSIDIGVYMLYSETDGCSVLSERIRCA